MRPVFRHPALILVLLGGLAFAAVPGFDLVWDDLHFLHAGSPLAQGSLGPLLASDWSLEGPRSGYYRPVVTLTLAVETRLFGVSPTAYHVMNVVYHLGAALALVWAARRILGSPTAAWLAGLVFVLHPIHTESVAWVSGRTDVIATLFFCLAVGCHARAASAHSPWMLGTMAAGAAAFLSKEPAIVLPAVLLAWELARPAEPQRPVRVIWLRLLPVGSVALGTLALRYLVLGSVAGPVVEHGLSERLATGVATVGRYLVLLVAPFLPTPTIPSSWSPSGPPWSAWLVVGSLATLAGLSAPPPFWPGDGRGFRPSCLPGFSSLCSPPRP